MGSINLWGIVLPKNTNILGKPVQTLRVGNQDKPKAIRLEFDEARGMVVVELEGKPEMPSTVLIPKEQISVIIPMPKQADLKYELFADDDDPTPAEQLAKANAKAKAVREAEFKKEKPKPYPLSTYEERHGGNVPTMKGTEAPSETVRLKTKPKKRGPKKGWKNKKK